MTEPRIIDGGLAVDDRGCVSFVNDFDFKDVKRFYMVENHRRGYIRAWHGHRKEAKYVFVPQGSIKLGVVAIKDKKGTEQSFRNQPKEFCLSSRRPQILYIPPGYYNGFQTLEENTKVIFLSTSTLEESAKDDLRAFYDIWWKDFWKENQR